MPSSFDLTFLENKLKELICFSSVFKNSFHDLGPLKEKEYLVLFKEHFFKLKLLIEKFVGYLCEVFLSISFNINYATLLPTLCIKLINILHDTKGEFFQQVSFQLSKYGFAR